MQNISQELMDALADADQLRDYCGVNREDPEATGLGTYLGEVAYLSAVACFRLGHNRRFGDDARSNSAVHAATLAARAAFRAVPGLRGGCDCDRCECERLTDRGEGHTACPSCNAR